MQAASLGMLARKPDSPCCSCLAWCLSTAEKDWKTGKERKSKVLPVPSSREFGKQKVNQKTFSIPPHDMPAFQHILPSMVNVAHTRSCCSPGNGYLRCVAFNVTQQTRNKRNRHFREFFVQRSCSVSLDCLPWNAASGLTSHMSTWKSTHPAGLVSEFVKPASVLSILNINPTKTKLNHFSSENWEAIWVKNWNQDGDRRL